MRRADRLFRIVQILRSRRLTTARHLAETLEISERTVYRDVRDLTLCGVPIEGEAGVGYRLMGYDLPPLMFTTAEVEALVLGARLVKRLADPKLAHAAGQALEKIAAALPERLRDTPETTNLYAPLIHEPDQVMEDMGRLRIAIDGKTKVRFGYTRADGTPSTRTVWPLGLFFWGSVWTLGAWCELRAELRSFRLDRMKNLELLGDTFENQPGRTLADLFRAEGHEGGHLGEFG